MKSYLFLFVSLLIFITLLVGAKTTFYLYLIIPLLIIALITLFKPSDYKEEQIMYEKYIIKPLICEVNGNFKMLKDKKIDYSFYDNAEFEKYSNPIYLSSYHKYLFFNSFAEIYGQLDERNIQFSEVAVGRDIDTSLFDGIFCCVTLKKSFYKDTIKIRKTKKIDNDESVIEITNEEFNRLFKVVSENKNLVYNILNSDNTKKILDLYHKFNNIFEITIKGNKLYIRFISLNVFKYYPSSDLFNKTKLKKIYDCTYFLFEIINVFTNIID